MPTPGASPWREPEHDDLAELARAFFTKEVLPHAERLLTQGHPDREHYRRAGELGLLGLSVPEEYGGGGGGFTHEAVLLHEQAYAGESSLGLAVHSGIVTGYLVAYGTEEQKRRWLPGLCDGELVGAIAMTEPGRRLRPAGDAHPGGPRRRRLRGDGAKTFITNGGLADLVIVAAKTDPAAAGARASRLLVCEVGDDPPGSGAAGCSTRSGCTPTTPPSCSSTTSGCRRPTCSAAPRARLRPADAASSRRNGWSSASARSPPWSGRSS